LLQHTITTDKNISSTAHTKKELKIKTHVFFLVRATRSNKCIFDRFVTKIENKRE